MPYKLFQDTEILTHTDVNTYFMDQALVVFDTYNEMTTAYGGDGEAPNKEGRIAYAKDTQQIYVYTDTDGLGTLGWAPQVAEIGDGIISAVKLRQVSGSEAVVENAIRTGAVTENKISPLAVVEGKIGALAVTEGKIGGGAVTSTKLGSSLTLAGTTTFGQIVEKATTDDITVLSSTATNINVLSGAVYRFTNATHSTGFKLNLRGDDTPTTLSSLMTANTQAITVVVSVLSGNPAVSFAASNYLTIDTNATVTIKWFGGTKPSGNVNSEDFYTFTIFKTGTSAFTVFASQSKFA